jgi:hypothetical protein
MQQHSPHHIQVLFAHNARQLLMLAAALNWTCTADATVHNNSTQVTRSPQQGLLPNRQGSKALHSRAHQRHHPSAQNCVPHSFVTLKGSLCGSTHSHWTVTPRLLPTGGMAHTALLRKSANTNRQPKSTVHTTITNHCNFDCAGTFNSIYIYTATATHASPSQRTRHGCTNMYRIHNLSVKWSRPWVGCLNPEPRSLPATPQFVSS